MKKRTTMLMSALFAAGAFALNGNVAKADNVQAVNNNNANSTEVKQNDVKTDKKAFDVAAVRSDDNENMDVPNYQELYDKSKDMFYEAAKETQGSSYNRPIETYSDIETDSDENMFKNKPEDISYVGAGDYLEDDTNVDYANINSQLNNAKTKVDTYLDNAVNNNISQLTNSKNTAREALESVTLPDLVMPTPESTAVSSDWGTLKRIYDTTSRPYLATLADLRTHFSSTYKDDAHNYMNKLAELVSRNVNKDKDWVLYNTNPYVPTALNYQYNKDLIKVDEDAYNRNHGIKSDENTSDNKNQSTTDTKKDQASQNVTDNTTSKKDQSSEKVTNDTTSKKDQSTTSTSNTSSSNTNQTTESNSSTTSAKTTSDTKTPVANNDSSAAKTTDVVRNETKSTENTASVVKNDTKAATEKTTDVKVVAPAKNASNEVKTTDAAAKASDAHVVALNSKVNAGTTSTTPAAATKGSQAKATENKLPQAGTDEKISLFASLAGLSIASLGLGALGASKKRKND
ncbi:hypothetical protein A3P64_03775 [Lactobacillus johnsonii]|uniref:Gram-positive cocci surface proteins LPxTG domain-containing protein n=1 Tax=Lactobacillus johnsonii TaxID=33959 RepID=A0AAX0PVS1_LACJH|nr:MULTISPECIES: hypothetical protein [Lactobacillus]ARW75660.1 hypothetical protein A3P31_09075 [Lactobacillus johnsonii]ARW76380.1 hypothetical protein A3P32_03465 [Lactobacillus johnsonii]PAB52935.1 hypothetical protein A3P64_03775 [Lactobacillus johnsonii]PEG77026.1 hypothetical protein CP370_06970 [Lactobacillus sp. UMNPBX19]